MAILPVARPAIDAATSGNSELQRLRRRDRTAWAEVFEREHRLVFRAVLAQVGDRSAAEDITAQVFLEAMEGIGRYHDRGKPFAAWLLSIARHRSLDWHRRRRRETKGDPVELSTPGPEDGLAAALDALALLTPGQREVVHLRFVEGYQLDEVARLLGRSTGAVKALQHRALGRLRSLLSDTQGEHR